jgi:hypothetical protein
MAATGCQLQNVTAVRPISAHVITLVAAALVLRRIHDHDRVHECRQGCSRGPGAGRRTPAEPGRPVPTGTRSDAELGSDILSAHPLFRRRRTLISVGVDAS